MFRYFTYCHRHNHSIITSARKDTLEETQTHPRAPCVQQRVQEAGRNMMLQKCANGTRVANRRRLAVDVDAIARARDTVSAVRATPITVSRQHAFRSAVTAWLECCWSLRSRYRPVARLEIISRLLK